MACGKRPFQTVYKFNNDFLQSAHRRIKLSCPRTQKCYITYFLTVAHDESAKRSLHFHSAHHSPLFINHGLEPIRTTNRTVTPLFFFQPRINFVESRLHSAYHKLVWLCTRWHEICPGFLGLLYFRILNLCNFCVIRGLYILYHRG